MDPNTVFWVSGSGLARITRWQGSPVAVTEQFLGFNRFFRPDPYFSPKSVQPEPGLLNFLLNGNLGIVNWYSRHLKKKMKCWLKYLNYPIWTRNCITSKRKIKFMILVTSLHHTLQQFRTNFMFNKNELSTGAKWLLESKGK